MPLQLDETSCANWGWDPFCESFIQQVVEVLSYLSKKEAKIQGNCLVSAEQTVSAFVSPKACVSTVRIFPSKSLNSFTHCAH
jgi:hypothetical protein